MKIFNKCEIEDDIISLINADKSSEKKRIAKKSEDYYEARHDILSYKIFYFNADGELVEDESRSNIKISHPFYTELIDQKVNYLLSKAEITAKKESDTVLKEALLNYFNDDFFSELAETEEQTSKIGFSYMYAQLDKNFRTQFKSANGLGVIEVRKEDSDELIAIIYYYIDRIDKGRKVITRVEVWDKDQTFYYVLRGRKLEKDLRKEINPQPHKTWTEEVKGELKTFGEGFGYIPFFRLDNNKKQFSDLKPIKALIDDYDLMSCGLSNNLQDVSEGIYVVKGYEGDNLNELQQNIKTKKIVGVAEDGDVDIKTINIPFQARKEKMELNEKNIYRFGMGFNSAQLGDGNITNIVIKSRYALLDLKCNKSERRLRPFLKRLIQIALDEINKENKTNYTINDVAINLEREVMTNASDNAQIEKTEAETRQIEVNTILNVATYIPEENIIKQLCEVLDIDYSEIEKQVKEIIDNKGNDLDSVSDKLIEDEETPTNAI